MIETLERTKIVDFAQERMTDELIDEMIPLWMDHYEEIALYKDIKLSPAIGIYEQAQKNGSLKIYTARYEGKLVGYEVFFVHPHTHYAECKSAHQDILFLSKELRQGLTGYRFIKWCDEQLKHEGVDVTFQHVKVDHDFSPLLERLGYTKHDLVYSRRLK